MTLRTFLETDLGFGDAANVEIQRVHRIGKKREESPRPILARFLRSKRKASFAETSSTRNKLQKVPRSSV